MRSLSRQQEEFDRDAAMMSESRGGNVSPWTSRFEIATTPGAPPRRYKLEPGQSVHLQLGYTQGFTGAGRQPVRAPIESLTEREVWPKGPTLPQVVHEDKATEMRQRWLDKLAKGAEPPKPVDVMLPSADGGEPIKMTVSPSAAAIPPAQAAAVAKQIVDDDEDQAGGQLDEPPPDHNDPIEDVVVPSAAPSAPVPTRGKSK